MEGIQVVVSAEVREFQREVGEIDVEERGPAKLLGVEAVEVQIRRGADREVNHPDDPERVGVVAISGAHHPVVEDDYVEQSGEEDALLSLDANLACPASRNESQP